MKLRCCIRLLLWQEDPQPLLQRGSFLWNVLSGTRPWLLEQPLLLWRDPNEVWRSKCEARFLLRCFLSSRTFFTCLSFISIKCRLFPEASEASLPGTHADFQPCVPEAGGGSHPGTAWNTV